MHCLTHLHNGRFYGECVLANTYRQGTGGTGGSGVPSMQMVVNQGCGADERISISSNFSPFLWCTPRQGLRANPQIQWMEPDHHQTHTSYIALKAIMAYCNCYQSKSIRWFSSGCGHHLYNNSLFLTYTPCETTFFVSLLILTVAFRIPPTKQTDKHDFYVLVYRSLQNTAVVAL